MIHTVYSNSYEVLQAVLLNNMTALGFDEPSDVTAPDEAFFARAFEKVPVIIPSRAVEENLRMALARRDGVCAGMAFMPLSAWMGFFSKEPLANVVGNEADWMIWRILREDGPKAFRHEPGHERLSHYLDGKNDVEIYALARHISAAFVVYSTYRVDWVLEWLGIHPELVPNGPGHSEELRKLEAHPDFVWQRDLWRRLAEREHWQGKGFLSDFPDTLLKLAQSAGKRELTLDGGRRVPLPSSLHIFVPFVVPPLMLPILKALAQSGRDVWFYLLNPTSEYWFDLVPRQLFDWRKEENEEAAVGHPLLADNGLSTRANIDRIWRFTAVTDEEQRLTEIDLPPAEAPTESARRAFLKHFAGRAQDLKVDREAVTQSFYLESREPALLRRIQDSILKLENHLGEPEEGKTLFRSDDRSLTFMRAPTATRELEGLADWLQDAFRKDPTLKPSDVLAVTPDISAAAPLVDKVFGSLPEGRRIDWRFTGLRALDTDTAAQALFALADLMTGRARREDFEAWLSMPLVSQRFRLSGTDLSTVTAWLRSAGYRYGLSDSHLTALDAVTFANVKEMSLARAVERLTLGLMQPDSENMPFGDTIPVRGDEDEGWVSAADQPELVATLARVSSLLEAFRARTEGEQPARVWATWIADAFGAFFPPERGSVNYSKLRTVVAEMRSEIERASDANEEETCLSFGLFVRAVSERMEAQPGGGSETNAVTFTGMSQLRGLPYRIIAIFGLNDDCAFPGTTRREEFDLMAAVPRRGDRDSRIDNRNVFLDLLLAARERFLISYVCGTGAGSAERRPSVVAQELYDWLLTFAHGREERRAAEKALSVTLSLNAFSPDNFRRSARGWRSHDAKLFEAVKEALQAGYRAKETPFADCGIAQVEKTAADLEPVSFLSLYAFWRSPSDWVLKTFGIRLPDALSDQEEGLMPDTDTLAVWKRRMDAFNAVVSGEGTTALSRRWLADPRYGAEGVRDWAVSKDLRFGSELAEAYGRRIAALTPADDLELCAQPDPTLPPLTHRLTGVYLENGVPVMVRATASGEGGGGIVRAFFEYALALSAGVSIGCEIFYKSKDDKTKLDVPSCLLLPDMTPEEAARIVRALMTLYMRTAASAAALTDKNAAAFGSDGEEENRAESMLWRGRALAEAKKIREKLDAAVKAMTSPKSKPEARVQAMNDFESAAGQTL